MSGDDFAFLVAVYSTRGRIGRQAGQAVKGSFSDGLTPISCKQVQVFSVLRLLQDIYPSAPDQTQQSSFISPYLIVQIISVKPSIEKVNFGHYRCWAFRQAGEQICSVMLMPFCRSTSTFYNFGSGRPDDRIFGRSDLPVDVRFNAHGGAARSEPAYRRWRYHCKRVQFFPSAKTSHPPRIILLK